MRPQGTPSPAVVRVEWLCALALTAAAVAVLVVTRARHAGPLWRDEAGALAVAQLPTLGAMFRDFPHEAFPLAFPLTVRAWLAAAGASDAALRAFGAVIAALLIAALWMHARLSRTLPLASLALFALSPLGLFVTSIRGYGLACMATVLALAAHRQLVERVTVPRLLAASVASLIAAHAAMHDAALLLAIGGAATAVTLRRQGWRPALSILACDALVALSLTIYIPPLAAARAWDITQRGLPWETSLASFRDAIGGGTLLFALAIAAVAIVAALPAKDEVTRFYLACLPLIAIVYYVWLQVLGYLPRTWYFVPVAAVGCACIDGLLASRRRSGFAVAIVSVAIACWLLPRTAHEARVRASNVDLVTRELGRAAAPHDLVIVNPWFYGVSFARYYRGAAPWTTLPEVEDHRMHRYDLVMRSMSRPNATLPLLKRIESTLRAGNAVWLAGAYERPSGAIVVPPPAPNPDTGWADAPYLIAWSQQLGDTLAAHSTPVREELLMKRPTSGYETLALRAFRGWR